MTRTLSRLEKEFVSANTHSVGTVLVTESMPGHTLKVINVNYGLQQYIVVDSDGSLFPISFLSVAIWYGVKDER